MQVAADFSYIANMAGCESFYAKDPARHPKWLM